MPKAQAAAVVTAALSYLKKQPPVPYSQLDCQGFVEACVQEAGGEMQYIGSNDMYRNACSWTGTLQEARQEGLLLPGALLFIVAHDGGEPSYYKDTLGNASHVGLYCGAAEAEVMHSSASRGQVGESTLKNGWTHVGLAGAIEYADPPAKVPDATPGVQMAVVDVPAGESLRMRKSPSASGEYMLRIPAGTRLMITARQNGFGRTSYNGHAGWVDERFLCYLAEGDGAAPPEGTAVCVPREAVRAMRDTLARWLEEA